MILAGSEVIQHLIDYQINQMSDLPSRLETGGAVHFVGCHRAGKTTLLMEICSKKNVTAYHISQDVVRKLFELNSTTEFFAYIYDIMIGYHLREDLEANIISLTDITKRDHEKVKQRIFSTLDKNQRSVFVVSLGKWDKYLYNRINQRFQSLFSNKQSITIVYTAWPIPSPFTNSRNSHYDSTLNSRFDKQLYDSPNKFFASPVNPFPLPFPLKIAIDVLQEYVIPQQISVQETNASPTSLWQEAFCDYHAQTDSELDTRDRIKQSLYKKLPEALIEQWCGTHLGSTLFLAQALSEHYINTSTTLPINERIKQCIRRKEPDAIFSEILRQSIGYDDIEVGMLEKKEVARKHGLLTSEGKFVYLLEYRTSHDPSYLDNLRHLVVRFGGASGFLIKEQSQWYVLTCGHVISRLLEEAKKKSEDTTAEVTITSFRGMEEVHSLVLYMHPHHSSQADEDIALLPLPNDSRIAQELDNLNIKFPIMHGVLPVLEQRCYTFGYGTFSEDDGVRELTWKRVGLQNLQSISIPVSPGDSGSPIWYWDGFEFYVAGMVVAKQDTTNIGRAIQANKLYRFIADYQKSR